MQIVRCEALDRPVVVHDVSVPEPGPGEVLIRVARPGLNYVDALICLGRYQIRMPLPFTPGSEVAGTVAATGSSDVPFAVGDRVLAMVSGGYSEYVCASAGQCFALPEPMTFGQGATFVQSYSTMAYAYTRAGLVAEDCVLVLGAAGGVGRAAIDLALARGARVFAAASSDSKLAACRAAGAHGVINYETEDLKERARELSGGGVDIVVDPVGSSHADPALRSLRERGRYLVIGFAGGGIPSLPLNQVLLRNREVLGIDWGAWQGNHREEQRGELERLLRLAGERGISPQEPVTYPLASAQQALEDLLERRVDGKAVLVPGAA